MGFSKTVTLGKKEMILAEWNRVQCQIQKNQNINQRTEAALIRMQELESQRRLAISEYKLKSVERDSEPT